VTAPAVFGPLMDLLAEVHATVGDFAD
jgi:hypothetical protein